MRVVVVVGVHHGLPPFAAAISFVHVPVVVVAIALFLLLFLAHAGFARLFLFALFLAEATGVSK